MPFLFMLFVPFMILSALALTLGADSRVLEPEPAFVDYRRA